MLRTILKSQRQYVTDSNALRIAAKLKGAKSGTLPEIHDPAFATAGGDSWVHEIKFDGHRLQAMLFWD